METIEVNVYIPSSPEAIFYDEVELEIDFEIESDQTATIISYFTNRKRLTNEEFESLKEHNPTLDKRIANAIDHYITNYEPDYEED